MQYNPCNHLTSVYDVASDTFKGANTDLRGKVLVMGVFQVLKYNKAYKALIIYLGENYGQRTYRAFKQKNTDVGRNMLTRPGAPMIDKVVQVATLGAYSKLEEVTKSVLDKDGESFVTYQRELKQYLGNVSRYNDI